MSRRGPPCEPSKANINSDREGRIPVKDKKDLFLGFSSENRSVALPLSGREVWRERLSPKTNRVVTADRAEPTPAAGPEWARGGQGGGTVPPRGKERRGTADHFCWDNKKEQ